MTTKDKFRVMGALHDTLDQIDRATGWRERRRLKRRARFIVARVEQWCR